MRLALWVAMALGAAAVRSAESETSGGWRKFEGNPVLGGKLGTCFDVALLRQGNEFWMYFSWRPKHSIALVKSRDGIHWGEPRIVLGPTASGWEEKVNRPSVVRHDGRFLLWYTGQSRDHSWLGLAASDDGVRFKRLSTKPVLAPTEPWEKVAVMCPHVLWDRERKAFRMWYSGGEQYEPNAIGYATSRDGIHWEKWKGNPVFKPQPRNRWERDRVTACQVVRHGGWHVMFYVGFEHKHLARIGLARSRDGTTGWERHPQNPIISPGKGRWDGESCYKPFALFDEANQRWLLWYNGRSKGEQIGLATHEGEALWPKPDPSTPLVLKAEKLEAYVRRFNSYYPEKYRGEIPNAAAGDFLKENVPLFECPDKQFEETYYFRWWTYRKHIKKTPDGFVLTEFLPKVGWSGKHNTISCAAGHHFREGRWLRDPRFLRDYAVFWFRKGGQPRRYSFWAADALWAWHMVHPHRKLLIDLLDDLVANYRAWEKSRRDPCGLFWQIDDRDGMELSIGGSGYRATINSYMYGDAIAIARVAAMAGRGQLAREFEGKAAEIKRLVQAMLWDPEARFFKVRPRTPEGQPAKQLADVRELHGYVPWYFSLPDPGYEVAWKQLMNPEGFYAPFGPTTAERRHPRFMFKHRHDCLWNGPSWPYATTQTLVAMANLLNHYHQSVVTRKDYFTILRNYTRSQRKDGKPWIAEDLDGITGKWIVDKPRSVFYNHSGYCDLVITGLVGLRPRDDDTLVVNPLLPSGTWRWFCLDNVFYRGRGVTILWDATGEKYGKGRGLRVFADGRLVAARDTLGPLRAALP